MTPKMVALLAGGIFTWVAGTPTHVYIPKASTTVAELLDAGIVADYTPRRLGCMVYLDGGYREKRPIVAVAKVADPDGGARDSIWPRAARFFRDQIGDANQNCRVIQVLTWGQVANFEADLIDEPGGCACWNPDAGKCSNADGGSGTQNAHNEFQPDDWVGPGCVAKPCGEMFGVSGWPQECVQ